MFEHFRKDAARFIHLGSVVDYRDITPAVALRLLYHYNQLRAMAWYRFGVWTRGAGIPFFYGYSLRRIRRVHGLEISCQGTVGGGLYIAHTVGTVIMAKAIGENVSVIASVTVGMRNTWAFPVLEDNVFIGAGARVLGDIRIGSGASIGANAVVITDVPAGATAVGIPARIRQGTAVPSTVAS